MKKWSFCISLLLSLLLTLLTVLPASAAETLPVDQVVTASTTAYYDAQGNKLTNASSLGGNAVVRLDKSVEQYTINGQPVENEFVVTLNVRTTQDLEEISSPGADAAVMLVLDVSNSMDNCTHCDKEKSSNASGNNHTITYYNCPGASTTYLAGNYGNCAHCHRSLNNHNVTTATHQYESRLEELQNAALAFIEEFATQTGAQGADRRMVGIVSFASNVKNEIVGNNYQTNWIDVTTDVGMRRAQNIIGNLKVAHGNSDNGGTNVEGGLMLARNIIDADLKAGKTLDGFGHIYTILLSDGNPTFHMSSNDTISTTSLTGTKGGSNVTMHSDVVDVESIGNAIRGRKDVVSKLYSICFGKVGVETNINQNTKITYYEDVFDIKPFTWDGASTTWKATTVGQWLGSFSDGAFNGQAEGLFDTFDHISQIISIMAKAWRVEDVMGDYIYYEAAVPVSNNQGGSVYNNVSTSKANNGIVTVNWDLLSSDPNPAISDIRESGTSILGYTYKYRIKLDNMHSGYVALMDAGKPVIPTNESAKLDYVIVENNEWPSGEDAIKTGYFGKPEVKGLDASFSFIKKDELTGEVMPGITFRLTSEDRSLLSPSSTENYREFTSDANGVITITDIPSGHKYWLNEQNVPDKYQEPGGLPIEVNWGVVSETVSDTHEPRFTTDENNNIVFYNKLHESQIGTIHLSKAFKDTSFTPNWVHFDITSPNGYEQHVVLGNRYDTEHGWEWSSDHYYTLTNLPLGEYTIVESYPEYDEYDVSTEGSYAFNETPADGESTSFTGTSVTVNLTDVNNQQTVYVDYLNTYAHKMGKLQVSKAFCVDEVYITAADMAQPGYMGPDDLDELKINVAVYDVNDPNKSVAELTLTINDPVKEVELPTGTYRVVETIVGTLDHYTLTNQVYTPLNPVVTGGETTTVQIDNHYKRDLGRIDVYKVFDGDMTAEDFASLDPDQSIQVQVLADTTGDDYSDDLSDLVLAGTITLDASNRWHGFLSNLPTDLTYVVQESGHELDDYTVSSNWTGLTDGQVHVAKDSRTNLILTNTYAKKLGKLEITKVFAGDISEEDYQDLTIYVDLIDGEGEIVDTLTLNAATY